MKKILTLLTMLSVLLLMQSAWSQDSEVTVTTKSFEDWQVRCEHVKGSDEICVMTQQALMQNSGQRLMQVNVGKNAEGTQMTLVLPLGISLPAGAALNYDESNTLPLVIAFCTQQGCFVNQTMDSKMIEEISTRDSVTVGLETNDGKALELPISSKGFSPALKEL